MQRRTKFTGSFLQSAVIFHRESGLTWERVAHHLNVNPRTLHDKLNKFLKDHPKFSQKKGHYPDNLIEKIIKERENNPNLTYKKIAQELGLRSGTLREKVRLHKKEQYSQQERP